MEDYMMTIIKKASIFMLLAQSLIHFRPSPSYEKYFKFLVGTMTTVIFIVPILEVLQKGTIEEYQQRAAEQMKQLKQRSEKQLFTQALDAQESMTLQSPTDAYLSTSEEEIKTKLNNYASEKGLSIKAVKLIYEDADAVGFGLQAGAEQSEESLRLVVTLGSAEEESRIQVKEVEEIKIGRIGAEDKPEQYTEESRADTRKAEAAEHTGQTAEIRKELAALLEMNEEKLEVELGE